MSARNCSICFKVSLWLSGADVMVMVWFLVSCVTKKRFSNCAYLRSTLVTIIR